MNKHWEDVIKDAPGTFDGAWPIIKKLEREDQVRLVLFICKLDAKVCSSDAFIEFAKSFKDIMP